MQNKNERKEVTMNKNTAMITRLLIGWGLKTYIASGTMILYVKKKKNALQIRAKKYGTRKEELTPAKNAVQMNKASA